jgi:hypothetical protein
MTVPSGRDEAQIMGSTAGAVAAVNRRPLPVAGLSPIFCTTMFVVTEADAAAIRAIFERDGELSAAIEVRRRFPLMMTPRRAHTPGPSPGGSRCRPLQ